MSAPGATHTPAAFDQPHNGVAERDHGRRLSTETKASFKTTELVAYVAVLIGLFVAGAVTDGGPGAHNDPFGANRVWLYATILTVGYLVSRGLAKAGSRQPYDENRS